MLYYAIVEDEESGLCNVGLGDDEEYYLANGFALLDVEKAYNGNWYLSGKLPVQPLDEAKIDAMRQIDQETSGAILAGFDYSIDAGTGTSEMLHFSYDSFDQQNFADTANIALLNLAMPSNLDAGGVPTSVTWNAYRNYTPQTGGELVRLTLDAQAFLALYTGGALAHKALQMEIGGQRKAAVESATTVEEVEAAITGTPSKTMSGAQA